MIPTTGDGTVLRPLSVANTEPGGETIRAVVLLLHAVLRPVTRRDWRHQDRLPPTGGVIIVANHISYADPLALGQFVAFSGRWPRFLAKASLFRAPILGRILRGCGQIPVDRLSRASRHALEAAEQSVAQGRAVVIYPEGTITADPEGWPMRGRTGAVRLALETGCPVIPIGQWGAQEIMPGRKPGWPRLFPRKTLRLVVGDPVDLDDLRGAPVTSVVLTAATDRIMDAITRLVVEVRGGTPPDVRFDLRTTG